MSGFSGMFQVLAQKSMLLELMAAQNSFARKSSLIWKLKREYHAGSL
jgi:hypothetical protein